MISTAEARLKDEMQKLSHLSEFVQTKEKEAQSKLEQADELSKQLQEMDSSLQEDSRISQCHQQEVADARMSLARERVALLKARANERENISIVYTPRYDLGMIHQPTFGRALRSIKSDLNRLRLE